MIRIIRLLLALVALIVIIAFAVANRTPVDVSFAPFPITVELPLYGAFLLGPGDRRADRRHRRLARHAVRAAPGAPPGQPGQGAREPARRLPAAGGAGARGGLCPGAAETGAGWRRPLSRREVEADAATRDFYDRLAADYHLIYDDWDAAARRQAALLDRLIRGELGPGASTLLDGACGIGTQALGLAALGWRVTASDLSPQALARAAREARRRGLAIEFLVADLRELDRRLAGRFDVVLAADNALPHLPSAEALAQAVAALAGRLAPAGLLVASIRDYDAALTDRPETWPARLLAENGRRRIVQQVWEWLDERRYRLHLYITRELADGWRCDHHVACYRALRRAELTALLAGCGLGACRWLMPEATGYHQPIVLARRGEKGAARCG